MPVLELMNHACNFEDAEKIADRMAKAIKSRGDKMPGFYFFRLVWVNPTQIRETLAALRNKRPDLNFEVRDPHTFLALFKEFHRRQITAQAPH